MTSHDADPGSLFARYSSAIRELPDEAGRATLCSQRFLLHREARLRIYYAPFDHVNGAARVAIVGLTPGWQQMQIAYRVARDELRAGTTPDAALAAVKAAAAFAGPMRANLVRMLDDIGVADALEIATSSSLFDDRVDLLHSTSAVRYPVFVDGKNYTGSNPALLKTSTLRDYVERVLGPELVAVVDALVIPLGSAVESCLRPLVDRGALDPARCLFGLPHPSGANGHRHRQYDERRRDLERTVRDWFGSSSLSATTANPTASSGSESTPSATVTVRTKTPEVSAARSASRTASSARASNTPAKATTLLIPETRDGSRFTVGLARPDGSYRVGRKGAERLIHGYIQALGWLTNEHLAGRGVYWRRPSATSGIPGIVTAVRWVEVEA